MKKMIILSLLLSLTTFCFAQQNEPLKTVPQTDYLKKARARKQWAGSLPAQAVRGCLLH